MQLCASPCVANISQFRFRMCVLASVRHPVRLGAKRPKSHFVRCIQPVSATPPLLFTTIYSIARCIIRSRSPRRPAPMIVPRFVRHSGFMITVAVLMECIRMASASILHVGDDLCHRIAVMGLPGLTVVQTDCSPAALQRVFAAGNTFAGIAFHNEISPPSGIVLSTARALSSAPLVLFHNPTVSCDKQLFDLVIPAHTPPHIWVKSLAEASLQVRRDRADVRSGSQELQRIFRSHS